MLDKYLPSRVGSSILRRFRTTFYALTLHERSCCVRLRHDVAATLSLSNLPLWRLWWPKLWLLSTLLEWVCLWYIGQLVPMMIYFSYMIKKTRKTPHPQINGRHRIKGLVLCFLFRRVNGYNYVVSIYYLYLYPFITW